MKNNNDKTVGRISDVMGFAITMDEMAQVADVGAQRSFAACFSSRSVDILKVSTIKLFSELVHEAAAESGMNVSGTEVQLVFAKFAYLMGDIF